MIFADKVYHGELARPGSHKRSVVRRHLLSLLVYSGVPEDGAVYEAVYKNIHSTLHRGIGNAVNDSSIYTFVHRRLDTVSAVDDGYDFATRGNIGLVGIKAAGAIDLSVFSYMRHVICKWCNLNYDHTMISVSKFDKAFVNRFTRILIARTIALSGTSMMYV